MAATASLARFVRAERGGGVGGGATGTERQRQRDRDGKTERQRHKKTDGEIDTLTVRDFALYKLGAFRNSRKACCDHADVLDYFALASILVCLRWTHAVVF